jgi:pyrophosphatase PpaX
MVCPYFQLTDAEGKIELGPQMTESDLPYSTILFDFDGTLTPSLDLWIEGLQLAFAKFSLYPAEDQIIDRCFYRCFEEIVSEFNITSIERFREEVHAGIWQSFGKAQLFAGVTEVLAQCRKLGIKLGVVTSSPRKIVSRTLSQSNIDGFFHSLVTADDVSQFKPHPEPILLSLARLGSAPEECLLIGDSSADILAGRAADIKTALFFPEGHARFYDYQELINLSPDLVFHHYEEILALVSGSASLL